MYVNDMQLFESCGTQRQVVQTIKVRNLGDMLLNILQFMQFQLLLQNDILPKIRPWFVCYLRVVLNKGF